MLGRGLVTEKLLADLLSGQDCTLDGQPARICGRLNNVATIVDYRNHKSVDFSWSATERIMLRDGNFKS